MKKNIIKIVTFALAFFIIINTFFLYGNSADYSVTKEFKTVVNGLKNAYPTEKDNLRIMSYNLLADTPGYYGNPAYSRSNEVKYLLDTLTPDVAGLQEASRNWFYSLQHQENMGFISPVKTTLLGTMTTIIYNKKTLFLSHWGEYVFQSTLNPQLRCAVWGVFKQKSTDKTFMVINTHFSLPYEEKDTAIKQTMEFLELANNLHNQFNCPIFFTGDFNSDKRHSDENASSCVYETLCIALTDTLNKATEKSFGTNLNIKSHMVDHIFLKGAASIKRYVILSQNFFSPLSDHYPIFIDTSLNIC